MEERWRGNIFVWIFTYEHFPLETKIEADAFTCTCFNFDIWELTDEIEIDISQNIPLDGQSFHLTLDVAAFGIAIFLLRDINRAVFFVQFPSCLLERIGLVLTDFAESRRCSLTLALEIIPEQLIALIYALCDILLRLRANLFEIRKTSYLLQLRQMLLQGIQIQGLVVEFPIPFMQGNTMVVCHSTNVDLLM